MTVRRLFRLTIMLAAMLGGQQTALAQETVAVVTRTVYPGQTIEANVVDEVVLRRMPKSTNGVALSVSEIEGKVALRTLLPNRLIPLSSVREAFAVERGTQVRVLFSSGQLVISATGVPLESGVAGDLVKVRNIDSGVIFSGTVMADGTIRVGAT